MDGQTDGPAIAVSCSARDVLTCDNYTFVKDFGGHLHPRIKGPTNLGSFLLYYSVSVGVNRPGYKQKP